jgi:hypothetical protein
MFRAAWVEKAGGVDPSLGSGGYSLRSRGTISEKVAEDESQEMGRWESGPSWGRGKSKVWRQNQSVPEINWME